MSRQLLRQVALTALIVTLCTACAFQGSAGLISLALSSSLLTLFLLLTGGTQSGCEPSVDNTPAGEEQADAWVGPCLSQYAGSDYAGTDAGNEPDAWVGPCLSPPEAGYEYAGTEVGPCLSEIPSGYESIPLDAAPPLEDMGDADMGDSDMGDSDMGIEDMLMPIEPDEGMIGPCLSAPAPDMGASSLPEPEPNPDQKRAAHHASERAQVIERVSARGGLPADVLERIKKR